MEYKLSEQKLQDLMHQCWLKAKKFYSGKTDEYFYDYFESEKKQLPIHDVSKSFPCGDDWYNSKEIEEIYKCGERGLTFYKKKGGVILPRNYEGVDG